jgi:hypothetical protein
MFQPGRCLHLSFPQTLAGTSNNPVYESRLAQLKRSGVTKEETGDTKLIVTIHLFRMNRLSKNSSGSTNLDAVIKRRLHSANT